MFEPEDQRVERYIAEFHHQMEIRKSVSQALTLFAARERMRKDMQKMRQAVQVQEPLHRHLVAGFSSLLRTLGRSRHKAPKTEPEQAITLDAGAFYVIAEDGTVEAQPDTKLNKESQP